MFNRKGEKMRRACVPYPIVIDGVHYASMFQAAIDTGLTYKTVWFKIAEKNGAPVTARGFKICSEEWYQEHTEEWEEFLTKKEQ